MNLKNIVEKKLQSAKLTKVKIIIMFKDTKVVKPSKENHENVKIKNQDSGY